MEEILWQLKRFYNNPSCELADDLMDNIITIYKEGKFTELKTKAEQINISLSIKEEIPLRIVIADIIAILCASYFDKIAAVTMAIVLAFVNCFVMPTTYKVRIKRMKVNF